MQLEFHQLDRRWELLRVRHPARQRRLLASLAESGQQTPIVVVAAEGAADRYVVIDGYKRIVALEQLGRDTVEADERSRGRAAGALAAIIRARNRVGGGLAAGGVGAALRLQPG
jgi:ParB family chromosome partitioning protein